MPAGYFWISAVLLERPPTWPAISGPTTAISPWALLLLRILISPAASVITVVAGERLQIIAYALPKVHCAVAQSSPRDHSIYLTALIHCLTDLVLRIAAVSVVETVDGSLKIFHHPVYLILEIGTITASAIQFTINLTLKVLCTVLQAFHELPRIDVAVIRPTALISPTALLVLRSPLCRN